ncbi:MAG: glycoside hydrolase family 3 protein [Clostridiales bacterium]|nr:glycoside hydrolase family 3 protein [Clostridiales bacterium]
MTKVSKYAAAIISTFLAASCFILFFSASSKTVPARGALPSIYSERLFEEVYIEDDAIPLDEFSDALLIEEPDPYGEHEANAREILASMTDDEKLYQLFFVTPEALSPRFKRVYAAGEATRQALEAQPVGGIVYFGQNLVDADQTAEMLANTQSYTKIPLFLGVDEEGGRVSRISSQTAMGFEEIPPMGEIGASGDLRRAYEAGVYIGNMLSSLGFNLDFAPVADVLIAADNEVIGNRSFGSDPELVSMMTANFTEGLRSSGTAATLKHFPGHGSTNDDSHSGRAVSERTLEEMREAEFLPFISGIEAGADLVMLSHISAANVDAGDMPSSMSKEIAGLLREELGFRRVIITDALNMGAVAKEYAGGLAAVQALLAGADMLLMPNDLTESVQALREALESGDLTWERVDESVVRILTVKLEREIIK